MRNIKRIFIAAMAFIAYSQADAQVTFRPGIRAGANFSHFTDGDNNYNYGPNFYYDANGNLVQLPTETEKFNSRTDFYVGFYGALKLTRFYTLQPEFTYSNQGSEYFGLLSYYNVSGSAPIYGTRKLTVSYLSVAMINKFNFSKEFNMHVGPTIDFVVDKNYKVENDVDLAFTLGLGYNFTKNLGLEARIKKGIIPSFYTENSGDHTNVVFSAGLTYTFDVK